MRMLIVGVLCLVYQLTYISSANATSIIFKFEDKRIYIAADTRYSMKPSIATPLVIKDFHDDSCKIVPLGKAAFAVTGISVYHSLVPGYLDEWDATDDAKKLYAANSGNLDKVVAEWSRRALDHYINYYKKEPSVVRNRASEKADHILVAGFFAGWSKQNQPLLSIEIVKFDENQTEPNAVHLLYPAKDLFYSPHAITQELISGNTELAKNVHTKWKALSNKDPNAYPDWRWLEFLIQSTSVYDDNVGEKVNVLEIPPSGKYRWLQNLTCN